MAADHSNSKEHIPVFIDEVKFELASRHALGAQLRALPTPPLGPELDLWLEVAGPKDDELIRPESNYEVRPGSKFYTAPSTINPGSGSYVHS
ncbi:multiubiquitin domain-containing protein [Lysobacter solisilvae (ex Woo and Kim 2020)]|uniref:Multiubiquitin domain-containing protein n=1 Tax=Agrilutibacter terrestris TaxID=2865112 RepID=A0A7H0G0B2_9GAMM|nr:multiubiquitin domain-containing protein [Lysobacter terrestris]QNP41728.1 multiubiquitin domain-containing protein [Lysobacter terrestris]